MLQAETQPSTRQLRHDIAAAADLLGRMAKSPICNTSTVAASAFGLSTVIADKGSQLEQTAGGRP